MDSATTSSSDRHEAHGRVPNPIGPLIFISAAEASADNHGAALIRATRVMAPGARFIGVAGPRMVEAGCESIYDMTRHAAMLLGAVANAGRAVRMLSACDRYLRQYHVDAVVVIDSPVLHLPLAAKAHALNIPVLYYIAPQMWAWGMYRIHKLRSNVDKVACILPFEEKFFRDQGIDATFVGHPSAEHFLEGTASLVRESLLAPNHDPLVRVADPPRRESSLAPDHDPLVRESFLAPPDASGVAQLHARGAPFIALLPGSRKHVVESILPGQLDVAQRIKAEFPRAAFAVSVANAQVAPIIDRLLSRPSVDVLKSPGPCAELIRAADLVLVASGTTALEVALHERPMIVMYKTSRLFYQTIGRWMIRTKYLSLPNILAGRAIVPEFMPYYTDTAPIVDTAIKLLQSEDLRQRMVQDLREAMAPLLGTRASQRTAEILLDLIRTHAH